MNGRPDPNGLSVDNFETGEQKALLGVVILCMET